MKGKMGVLMVAFCLVSFFLYTGSGKNKNANASNKEKIIRGIVVSSKDESPIEGVTIALQGQNYKSVTNGVGEYAIFTKESQELVFRHNNYKTIEVVAKDAKLVKMEPITSNDIERIDEALSKPE